MVPLGGVTYTFFMNAAAQQGSLLNYTKPLFDGVITNLFAEHAANHLTIPTPATNAEGGCTHPDVIDFDLLPVAGGKWNGYRYWMGFTPLPTLNPDPNENPCIVASNDKTTWVVPEGGSNPITPAPGVSYNSDTTLFYEGGKLYIFYRTWTQTPSNRAIIVYKYSTDGITWSDEVEIFNMLTVAYLASPCILKVGAKYYMYGIDASSATIYDKKLYRYQSNSINGFTKDTRELCTVDVTNTILGEFTSDKYFMWHLNVKYINGYYLALIYFRSNDGLLYGKETLYFAVSTDGLAFTLCKYPLFAKYATGAGKWDVGFYRSAFVPKIVNDKVWFDLWYPGWANNHEVFPTFIGYTEIKPIASTINHIYGGNTITSARVAELALAVAKNGYTFGDDCNRADGSINPSACGINYTITHGAPTIQSNYIAPSTSATTRFTLAVPLNYELSFDAINGDVAPTSDSGFQVFPKAKATAKWIGIYDGIYNTKVLKRVSSSTVELDRRHNLFLKNDLNNFKIIFNGAHLQYFVNGKIIFDKTFTVSDFVDQADMDDILGQTTLAVGWTTYYVAKIKNITIKAL